MYAGVTEDTFASLHETMAQYFIKALSNPESPIGLIKEAREFLKDNHVEGIKKPGNSLDRLSSFPALNKDGEDEEVPLRLIK